MKEIFISGHWMRICIYTPTYQKYGYIIIADDRNIKQCLLDENFYVDSNM